MVFGVEELVMVKNEVGLEVGGSPMVVVGSDREVVVDKTQIAAGKMAVA